LDNDGVINGIDKCIIKPETKNGYLDEDGCPDETPELEVDCVDEFGDSIPCDADNDGIPDDFDFCPHTPETINGFEDDNGCPDKDPNDPFDTDLDGINDNADLCKFQPETVNGIEDTDGCPDECPEGTIFDWLTQTCKSQSTSLNGQICESSDGEWRVFDTLKINICTWKDSIFETNQQSACAQMGGTFTVSSGVSGFETELTNYEGICTVPYESQTVKTNKQLWFEDKQVYTVAEVVRNYKALRGGEPFFIVGQFKQYIPNPSLPGIAIGCFDPGPTFVPTHFDVYYGYSNAELNGAKYWIQDSKVHGTSEYPKQNEIRLLGVNPDGSTVFPPTTAFDDSPKQSSVPLLSGSKEYYLYGKLIGGTAYPNCPGDTSDALTFEVIEGQSIPTPNAMASWLGTLLDWLG